MTHSVPKISVVIGCYNQRHVIEKALSSYASQTLSKEDYEVIVVDSSSTDGTSEYLVNYAADYQFNAIIQDNSGKAAARNRAAQKARAPLLLVTDADMIADSKLLEAHVLAHQSSSTPCCFEGLAWNLERLEWPVGDQTLTPQVASHPKDRGRLGWYYFLTGNLSCPKDLFEEQGGFDEEFVGYGWEDLELGYRLHQKNVPLYYLRSAVNYHYHLISKEDDVKRSRKKGESAAIFYRKHPELKWFLGMNPLSLWLHCRVKEEGRFYRRLEKKWMAQKEGSLRRRFASWFCSEHEYLTGLLSEEEKKY